MDTTCRSCGTTLWEGAKFCTRCGAQVGPAAAPEATSVYPGAAPTAEIPVAPMPTTAYPASPFPTAAPQATPQGAVIALQMPRWLAADWLMAVGFALLALVFGLVFQILLSFLLVFAQVSAVGGQVIWGDILRFAVTMFLSMHGPVGDLGLWLTGMFWLWVTFRLAAFLLAPERSLAQATAPRRGRVDVTGAGYAPEGEIRADGSPGAS